VRKFLFLAAGAIVLLIGVTYLDAGSPQPIASRTANREVTIQSTTAPNTFARVESSTDLQTWTPLATLLSPGTFTHTDSAAPYFARRFYRVQELTGTGYLTGDHLATSAGEVIIHPVNHASFVMSWNGRMIYNDPIGATTLYASFPRADLILVSHSHGDHYSNTTLAAVLAPGGKIIAPQLVYNGMTTALKAATTILANNASTSALGISIAAVPAYNANHPLGEGNGYVLTIGDKRLYTSGDTGNTAELRALPNIDVAFLCMNVPFTMSISDAVNAVSGFRPRVVYPYHFRNQDTSLADVAAFKQQVGTSLGVEVRLRTWY
jgi:L-ascorbate metabolism protein UlaG (beta-lactamase superfamily)